jgi:DNA repair protein RadC
MKLLVSKLSTGGAAICSPSAASTQARLYLNLALADKEHEVFVVLFLDNQNNLIEAAELFRGTIDGASVYPREVVKSALLVNAAAVILAHNHPSGLPEPSNADKRITKRVQDALELVDIRVIDHIIVGKSASVSFAERGLL